MSNGPAGDCEEQHSPFDDDLWDTVAAITEKIRGKGMLIAVNMTAAALVVTGVVLSEGLRDKPAGDAAVMIGVAALCAVGAVVIGYTRARRRAHRASGWVRERRPATAAERRSELWWARSTAVDVFAAWALSAVVLAALGTALGYPEPKVVRIAVLGTLAGCGAASMSFLLLEQIYRPVLQLALAGHAAPGGITLGLRWRLMLLWVLSGAAPISVLGTAWVGHTDKGLPVFLSVNAALSLVWGVAGTYLVAQSLIDPVTGVRAAQRRVEDGDLAVQIPVDHDGEVGQLQAGFNHMVAGLREHQRLNDIFGRHVGIEVARTALARGVRLGGERRPASVLFFDLIGSTAMTQRLPPEEVVTLLNDVFTVVVDCVSKEGGWVNKFEGDAAWWSSAHPPSGSGMPPPPYGRRGRYEPRWLPWPSVTPAWTPEWASPQGRSSPETSGRRTNTNTPSSATRSTKPLASPNRRKKFRNACWPHTPRSPNRATRRPGGNRTSRCCCGAGQPPPKPTSRAQVNSAA